ncbi:maleylpyruvate isomerase family mycothiol-dependent enzyme [Streptomyces sp. V4-01]|uniref:Maleylpyruvate isomerase family mycothiol-dependent enzyme n=1 Tax=Actinacidiphila polyblastidii TaxID=3110430 RepID=A0ABU7PHT9_9ACTN|nr:maleylpyruvate isomerase family mycothiol-dependent enzyme [Streptomyces sp. V4-01]
MAVTTPAPAALQAALTAGQERLRELLPRLTEEAVRAPSALPGWSRGHVLTHLEGVGLALARQARYALRGRQIEVYDGGRPARDAAIAAGHGRSATVLAQALSAALDEVAASWSAVTADDWARPVRYRDGTLLDAGLAWWREVEIHTTDALLGPSTADWPPAFSGYLVEYLAPRVPAGVRLTFDADDGPYHWTVGEGRELAVKGRLTDLAAWLAGRRPARALAGDPLPTLTDWP